MQINLHKNLITLTPEKPEERAMVRAIWQLLIDCNGSTRSLVPVGELAPTKNHNAQFVIEGPGADQIPEFANIVVDFECKVFCDTCNRIQDLRAGDSIPPCCGKLMEFMD